MAVNKLYDCAYDFISLLCAYRLFRSSVSVEQNTDIVSDTGGFFFTLFQYYFVPFL